MTRPNLTSWDRAFWGKSHQGEKAKAPRPRAHLLKNCLLFKGVRGGTLEMPPRLSDVGTQILMVWVCP